MEYAQAAPGFVANCHFLGSQTGIDRVAGLYVQGKGVLYASAGNNINITGAEIAGNGAVQLPVVEQALSSWRAKPRAHTRRYAPCIRLALLSALAGVFE